MVKGVVKERTFELLPEGWYYAKLLQVTTRQAGAGTILKWKWEIVDGEHQGKNLWGECWNFLDQGDGCVWRRWHEALIERPVGIDEGIDTDDVVNFLARVRLQHRSYEKDGETKWTADIPNDPLAVVGAATEDTDLPEFAASGSPESEWAGVARADDPWASANTQTGEMDKPPY